ncbi:hypothetical protein MRB53_038579 [Persea americana]|nr:hypothetical protein MRB53_038579 [Persea americana]
MSNKAALKAAKAAFDASKYEEAITQTQSVLESDPSNYNAKLLLGRAQEKQRLFDDAEKTYRSATTLKPDDFQAWSGLCSALAAQGNKNIDASIEATKQLATIHADAEENEKCQNAIDKLYLSVRQHGKPAQIRQVLGLMLPTNPLYTALEGRVPHPTHTYTRIAESLEAEEKQTIEKDIAQRRTRIGAKLGQVTTEVKREVLGKSELDDIYRQIINWSSDDEARHTYEEKLLERAYDLLVVLLTEAKPSKLDEVLTMAEGLVIIHHPFRLAWDLVLESRDLDNLQDMDVNILHEYISYFPSAGMTRVLEAWLSSDLSPFKSAPAEPSADVRPINPEDRLLMFADGVTRSKTSTLAARLASSYYLSLDEFETAMQSARAGLQILQTESQKLGLTLQNTRDALNSTLGTALVVVQAPRNHPDAKRLFEDILTRKPKFTSALIGLGLILEETQEYQKAIDFFEQGLQQDPANVQIAVECAWCRALDGEYASCQQQLEEYLPQLSTDNPKSRALRAQCLYRIGICMWELDQSKSARKDRNRAYAKFLNAIKTDVEFAPAYTSLGHYYELYAKDKKRARQCFQKAFELSPAETDAAERLARSFANQGDWEIVQVICQRVIDSGRARPPPGSKRKALSWPYSALGVAQMNKLEYQQAISSFLAALRIDPDDYQSYVGLGESYHNSGRYNSASRTLTYALESQKETSSDAIDEAWFAKYMLSNVHRELGEFDEAIAGLKEVLTERPDEFGVLMSLLQTYNEKSWRCMQSALFGQATEAATSAVGVVERVSKLRPIAFNLWKGLGDSIVVFTIVQNAEQQSPLQDSTSLLEQGVEEGMYDTLTDIDLVSLQALKEAAGNTSRAAIQASILAYKRALYSCANDVHAQAVAWYNLGWIEHRAFACSEIKEGKRYLKAAVRCFKRAIELEAGNSEFWNALGVVTTTLNPKVAQHSLVRSLHINELNAKVWTNLGVLYLLQHDYELAEQAFGRSQSTDPEYAHAWVGAGLISLMTGDTKRALNDFTHAFEISDSISLITKQRYSTSAFDHLLATPSLSSDLTTLIQPLFALEQLYMQAPQDLPYRHLAALFLERVGSFTEASEVLSELCLKAEGEYEATESAAALARYAHAKSDLARSKLALHRFDEAAENAETALDLTAEAEHSGLDVEERLKLRLSAHLTAGLAFSSLDKSEEAISMFQSALSESENNPDVVCVLVKMLWTHGGEAERGAARDQLFECVEKHPDHAGSLTLLGTIAILDGDDDTKAAVHDDLLALRTSDKIDNLAKEEIETLLSAFASLQTDVENAELYEAQAAALLDPSQSLPWSEMASISGEANPARVALQMASKMAPPQGTKDAESLGTSFALTGTVGDAQRAICLAPWQVDSWVALQDSVRSD